MSCAANERLSLTQPLPNALIKILAQLFARDDAVLTVQLLTCLCGMAKLPAVSLSEERAAASAITNTVACLVVDGDEETVECVVLVAAAKYGCSFIVNAILASSNLEIPLDVLLKAKCEAQTNKQVAIAEMLSRSVTAAVTRRGVKQQPESDTSMHTNMKDNDMTEAKFAHHLPLPLDGMDGNESPVGYATTSSVSEASPPPSPSPSPPLTKTATQSAASNPLTTSVASVSATQTESVPAVPATSVASVPPTPVVVVPETSMPTSVPETSVASVPASVPESAPTSVPATSVTSVTSVPETSVTAVLETSVTAVPEAVPESTAASSLALVVASSPVSVTASSPTSVTATSPASATAKEPILTAASTSAASAIQATSTAVTTITAPVSTEVSQATATVNMNHKAIEEDTVELVGNSQPPVPTHSEADASVAAQQPDSVFNKQSSIQRNRTQKKSKTTTTHNQSTQTPSPLFKEPNNIRDVIMTSSELACTSDEPINETDVVMMSTLALPIFKGQTRMASAQEPNISWSWVAPSFVPPVRSDDDDDDDDDDHEDLADEDQGDYKRKKAIVDSVAMYSDGFDVEARAARSAERIMNGSLLCVAKSTATAASRKRGRKKKKQKEEPNPGQKKRGRPRKKTKTIINKSESTGRAGPSPHIRKNPKELTAAIREALELVDSKDKCKHSSGCNKNAKGKTKGMCGTHGGVEKCTHESGCEKGSQTKGLCSAHGGKRVCNRTGCEKCVVRKGYCKEHVGNR